MTQQLNSIVLDNTTFNVGDLVLITECDNDELNLYTRHTMRIRGIYIDKMGDTQISLFDTIRNKPYGSVIVATPIPKLYQVLTKLEKLS